MKTILYYTCNTHSPIIEDACRKQLARVRGDCELIAVSLNQKIAFGDRNLVIVGKRSPEMMHRQILLGLEIAQPGDVFLCESDVLYHKSHFDFTAPTHDAYYYNEHTYKVDYATGQAVFYYTKQVSGCCADRDLLLEHYRKRVKRIETEGRFSIAWGYEPGCHKPPRGIDDIPAERWMGGFPNVDIRHDQNITKTRWDPSEFRNKRSCEGWELVDEIPGWGVTKGRFQEFLKDVEHGLSK